MLLVLGAVELVDISSYLPNLKRSPGLKTWKVINEMFSTCELTVTSRHPIQCRFFFRGMSSELQQLV